MNRAGILLTILLLFPTILVAEFRCTAEIKYRWKKLEGPEVSSFWATIDRRGETEAIARELTLKYGDRERSRAGDACIRQHQNLSGCITSKLSAYSETLHGLPFASRAKLEESIAADCELSRGSCLGVDVAEPKCIDLAPPAPEETPEEDTGKGKKKKK